MEEFKLTFEIDPKIYWKFPAESHLESVQRVQLESKIRYFIYLFFMEQGESFKAKILEAVQKETTEIVNMTDRPKNLFQI